MDLLQQVKRRFEQARTCSHILLGIHIRRIHRGVGGEPAVPAVQTEHFPENI